jgi:hypothetical protein
MFQKLKLYDFNADDEEIGLIRSTSTDTDASSVELQRIGRKKS